MIGGKTGYTKRASRTLVTVSENDSKRVIIVTLNDGDDFNDHVKMADYVFSNYERVCLLNHYTFNVDNEYGNYYINRDYYALLNKEEKEKVSNKMEFLDNGRGIISFYLNDKYLISARIYSYNNEQKDNVIKRFIRWVFRW